MNPKADIESGIPQMHRASRKSAMPHWIRAVADPRWNVLPYSLRVAGLLLTFALVWSVVLIFGSYTPPSDNIEQMLWVQSLQWGYHKHPPFPTWLYWLPAHFFGNRPATTYALAALVNLTSLVLFWSLIRQLRGSTYALIALLAALCITYYNGRFTTYNHNTVLMLASTASAVLSWHACRTGRMGWWIALGGVLGLGMLTKYQIAISAFCVAAFWLSQRGWKDVGQRRGLLLAALLALMLFVPHLEWLRAHDFGPVGYALDSSLGASLTGTERIADVSNWLADQLLNRALLAWVLLFLLYRWHKAAPSFKATAEHAEHRARTRDSARVFILCWGLLPLVFMALVGLSAGSHLHLPWGTAFLLFAVPAAMEMTHASAHWERMSSSKATWIFVALQVVLVSASLLTSHLGPAPLRDSQWRSFNTAELANQLAPALRGRLGNSKLVAIAGPEVLAGALSFQLPNRPPVIIDGRLDQSPWIEPTTLAMGPILHIEVGSSMVGGTSVGGKYPDIWWRISWPEKSNPDVRLVDAGATVQHQNAYATQ
jgi:4-amino-4-deoxy-L-arabinose transferase-like glycosyltransferase